MQIIQKIRDKGAAIVIVVIALSLIGFILMDANLGMSRTAGGEQGTLGKVNGQKIDKQELEDKVKMYGEQYQVKGAQMNMLRQQVWEQMVRTKVEEAEYEKLGITFSPKELTSLIFSEDAPYVLKQAFTDKETGQYDLAKVQQWWTTAKKWKGEQRQQVESQIVEPTTEEALRNKYSGLLAASAYYPGWLKEKEAAEAKAFASISYVSVPYNVIADSTIKVTDEDINNYVSKHKAKYQQEGGRQVAYVSFSTNPSAADSADVFKAVGDLKANFAADSNVQAFLSRNSSQRNYDDAWMPRSVITGAQKDTLVQLPVGTVYGPYVDGSSAILAKLVKTRMLGDSIKCRHILIGTVDRETGEQLTPDSIAKQRADSIEMAIRGGASFDELETRLSTDKVAHKEKDAHPQAR
ncbi:MAG: SurA N-terminal domain-containing protein [Bacteroidota bacterium]